MELMPLNHQGEGRGPGSEVGSGDATGNRGLSVPISFVKMLRSSWVGLVALVATHVSLAGDT